MTSLEPIKNKTSSEPKSWPVDLSACVDKKSLVSLVLDAVLELEDSELRPVAGASSGIAFRPKNMLALLTYCYATGIYGSEDIEDVMYRDAIVRYFCGHEIPDWKSLRRFRRYNREAIHKCLEDVCAFAAQRQHPHSPRAARGMNCSPEVSSQARFQAVDRAEMAAEAERRLEQAMWIDSMALED